MSEEEQPDTESEDEDYDLSMFTIISQGTSWAQALQQPTHDDKVPSTSKTFAALETDDNDNSDSETDDTFEKSQRMGTQSSSYEAEVVVDIQAISR